MNLIVLNKVENAFEALKFLIENSFLLRIIVPEVNLLLPCFSIFKHCSIQEMLNCLFQIQLSTTEVGTMVYMMTSS